MSSQINGNDMSIPGTLTVGTLKYTGATAGQILVSDANGNMVPGAVAAGNIYSQSQVLAAGSDSGSVTGLGLTFTPNRVIAIVRKPADGDQIWASIVDGTLSSDGFGYELSAPPPDGAYTLDFIIL